MCFSRPVLSLVLIGAAACGPTYVVQSAPQPASQRVPVPPPPPRVEPLEVSIVRPDEGRVLVQTSRPAYLAVFEIVPGRGVSLVYPRPMQPRDLTITGLTWVNLSWTMRYDYRYASSDTRYIYAVASDTPLRVEDTDYERYHLERRLGSTFYSSSPNATVRSISREFVRAQPDEYWGEDMFTMALAPSRVIVTIRWARVYCPGGGYFEVREDAADHIWCPGRNTGRGRPAPQAPDSVFASNGRRLPRHVDPTNRTPIFRVPAPTDVGQQGQPQNPPRTNPGYPRTQPGNPQVPTNQPPQNQPPQNQPPQNQPPATQPPQNQPPQTSPQDPSGNGKDHDDNGRRAHGDPRNADPRGNGNGYGNGGRTQPSTQPTNPSTPSSQTNPQPQQQGQPQTQPGNNGRGNDNGNGNTNANNGNSGNDRGKNPNDAKPEHNDAPKGRFDAVVKKIQKQDDKKAASDSTKKP